WGWFIVPTPSYVESSAYGPVPMREVEWVEIDPIEQRHIGRLVPPLIIDHTLALIQQLAGQGISAQAERHRWALLDEYDPVVGVHPLRLADSQIVPRLELAKRNQPVRAALTNTIHVLRAVRVTHEVGSRLLHHANTATGLLAPPGEAQIVAILQQQAGGQTVAQSVREHGLSEATFYAWKSKYAGASVAELTRPKHLEEENRKLKQMFADLSLENQAIKEILRKK
nr:hypothetical protein [Tanacetum cinerariifolium]